MNARVWLGMIVAAGLLVVAGDVNAAAPSSGYVETLAYWFRSQDGENWMARLAEALQVAPAQDQEEFDNDNLEDGDVPSWVRMIPTAERVVLTGVPANSWWIDCWRQELDGSWVKVPAWQPASQLPGPVSGDLMIHGKLPAPYVIRVCDQSGAVLAGGPKLLLVSWTAGGGGTWEQQFDVPHLPAAQPAQLGGIVM